MASLTSVFDSLHVCVHIERKQFRQFCMTSTLLVRSLYVKFNVVYCIYLPYTAMSHNCALYCYA